MLSSRIQNRYDNTVATSFCVTARVETVRDHALFTACVFVGLLYVHHAFSRADLSHLRQALHPFTLGLIAAPVWFGERSRFRPTVVGALAALGLFLVGKSTPFYKRLISPVVWVRHWWQNFWSPTHKPAL